VRLSSSRNPLVRNPKRYRITVEGISSFSHARWWWIVTDVWDTRR